jgi:hypothetical protein
MLARALALAESLRDLDDSDLSTFGGLASPRVVRGAVVALRESFWALMERWGWTPALGANGSEYIRECRERHERDYQRRYYEAAMSLCGVDPTWNAAADQGEQRGYQATMTPEQAASVIEQLSRDLFRQPIFGSRLPHGDATDIDPIERATRIIAKAAEGSTPPIDPMTMVVPNPATARLEEIAASIREGLEYAFETLDAPYRLDLTEILESVEVDPSAGSPPEALVTKTEPSSEALLEKELRRDGKPTQAALVDFMRGKESALPSDVGYVVHDDHNASDKTIRGNLDRVNRVAESLGIALRYRLKGGKVWKD